MTALKSSKEPKKRGGARPGSGRPKGAKSKLKIEIEAIAMGYAASALSVLNQIATKGEVESARVAASIALLDRAGGKPRQAVDVGQTGPFVVQVVYSHE